MAEIEYFVDPDKKEISKFANVADLRCTILSQDRQMSGESAVEITLQEAFDQVSHSTIYFLYFYYGGLFIM